MEDDPLDGLGDAAPAPSLPAVVAVTVVFEPGPWFERTLDALAAQDYPNLRHLFLVAGEVGGDNWPMADRIRETLPDAHVHAVSGNPGFGPAANEVARLESISKVLGRTVLGTRAFVEHLDAPWESLGPQDLRGVGEPVEVFAMPES